MKKYSFLIYYKEYESFLEKLRSAGVIHIIEKGSVPENGLLLQKMDDIKRLKAVISILSLRKISPEIPMSAENESCDGRSTMLAVENIQESREKNSNSLALIQKEIEKMSVWGDFDYGLIVKLRDAGCF
ncbi:MAG: hypothetical protein LIO93_05860, partial [Bacteroidales bacterium]|nr:hypothetical protein [Bacteroidales bacterium]